MTNACIIQARLSSTRFPRKIFTSFKNSDILNLMLDKIHQNNQVDNLILAVPANQKEEIRNKLKNNYDFIFGGSENNLIQRYYQAYKSFCPDIDYIIRITADCPCINMEILNKMIDVYEKDIKKGYLCNTHFDLCLPSGLDIELFDIDSFNKILSLKEKIYKEHIAHAFRDSLLKSEIDLYKILFNNIDTKKSRMNFSIDSIDDLHFLNQVYHDDNQFLEYLNVNCEDFSISNLNQEWI